MQESCLEDNKLKAAVYMLLESPVGEPAGGKALRGRVLPEE